MVRERRERPGEPVGNGDEPAGPPVRRCLASGARLERSRLIRFVVGPGDEAVPDLENRLPGRGMWLSARRSVVNTACAKRLFAKAARAPVTAPEDLADRVERLLAGRCIDLIGLARRGGQVAAGYEKVRARLKEGRGAVLVAASDGAPGSRDKIRALAPQLPVFDGLTAAELGRALGRDTAVHAVVDPGGLAGKLIAEGRRLAGFRGPTEGPEHGRE